MMELVNSEGATFQHQPSEHLHTAPVTVQQHIHAAPVHQEPQQTAPDQEHLHNAPKQHLQSALVQEHLHTAPPEQHFQTAPAAIGQYSGATYQVENSTQSYGEVTEEFAQYREQQEQFSENLQIHEDGQNAQNS